jgi:hypothetical protein
VPGGVWWERESPTFSAHLPVGSLHWKNIGDEGARDLGAALRVNMTLKTLKYAGDTRGSPTTLAIAHTCTLAALLSTTSALQARGTWARRCRSTRR